MKRALWFWIILPFITVMAIGNLLFKIIWLVICWLDRKINEVLKCR
jgi:hypothetical protein